LFSDHDRQHRRPRRHHHDAGRNDRRRTGTDREAEQHRKASWLWSQRHPIANTVAETYLREARGITCALPPTLAYLPPLKPEHHPALVAAFALADEPEPGTLAAPQDVGAVHLTLLAADGTSKARVKPNAITVGSPGRLPITLAPANDLLALAITEGIEDALSVHQATGLGAWAAGNAGRLLWLGRTVPAHVEAVTIFAHADEAGQRGARQLADVLAFRGVAVFVEGLR
jgi:hypothetical protein